MRFGDITFGHTLLHSIVIHSPHGLIRCFKLLLLNDPPSNPNAQDSRGKTPLHAMQFFFASSFRMQFVACKVPVDFAMCRKVHLKVRKEEKNCIAFYVLCSSPTHSIIPLDAFLCAVKESQFMEINPNIQDILGKTPIHHVVVNTTIGKEGIAMLLEVTTPNIHIKDKVLQSFFVRIFAKIDFF